MEEYSGSRIPIDSVSQNCFSVDFNLSLPPDMRFPDSPDIIRCVVNVSTEFVVAPLMGPDSNQLNLLLRAVGPKSSRTVSPVIKFQYWSDPIKTSMQSRSGPSNSSVEQDPRYAGTH